MCRIGRQVRCLGDRSYGWEPSIGNDEILRELLALNALRSTPVSPAAAE